MFRERLASRLTAVLLCGVCALVVACDRGGADDIPAQTIAQAGPGGFIQAAVGGGGGTYKVIDNVGFGRPMAALEVMTPPGWRVESAVRWDNFNGQCSVAIASPMFRMTSPDGQASIELFPGFLVTTSEQDIRRRGSQPGDFCVLALTDSGEAFAQQVAVPFLRPQSQIRQITAAALDPDVASLAQRVQQVASMGGSRVIPYGVDVLLSNPDGTVEKITLGGVIMASPQLLQGVPPLVLNQNTVAYAVRAPADRLAETEALALRVRQSIRPNPEWKRAVEEHQQRMTRPVFPKIGGATGGSVASGPDWIDQTKKSWDAGQIRDDDIQRQRVETIREEQRCQRPDGSIVTQSIHVPC